MKKISIETMRKLDSYLGPLCCLTLDLFHRIKILFFRDEKVYPRNIVIVKFFGMGSLILTSKLLASLRTSFPGAKISLITFKGNKEIADILDCFDCVYTIRTDSLFCFLIDVASNLYAIRRQKVDTVIDIEFLTKFSIIFSYLSGANNRVGFYSKQIWRGDLLTHHVYFNHYKHISDVFAAAAVSLGAKMVNFPYVISIPQSIRENINNKLRECGIEKGEKIIILNPNASDLCKERKWPEINFKEVIDYLIDNKFKPILIGGQEDKKTGNRISELCGNPGGLIDFTGELTILQLIALLKRGDIFITNDSGPLHMAALFNINTISFYGPETPVSYGPSGTQNIVFYKGLYCSPCINIYNAKYTSCDGDNKCMQNISSEEVINCIKNIVSRWRKQSSSINQEINYLIK